MAATEFPIEAGHIMLFARSIGDENPIYHDREYAKTTEPGGIIAPPTFTKAAAQFDPDYGLRPRIGKPWLGSGRTPTGGGSAGGGARGLAAETRFEYHRHVRAGDVLTATPGPGKTWEKEGRRGGKLVFNESVTEFRDQNGELCVTMYSVGVRTEKVVEQPADTLQQEA